MPFRQFWFLLVLLLRKNVRRLAFLVRLLGPYALIIGGLAFLVLMPAAFCTWLEYMPGVAPAGLVLFCQIVAALPVILGIGGGVWLVSKAGWKAPLRYLAHPVGFLEKEGRGLVPAMNADHREMMANGIMLWSLPWLMVWAPVMVVLHLPEIVRVGARLVLELCKIPGLLGRWGMDRARRLLESNATEIALMERRHLEKSIRNSTRPPNPPRL
jgi:hypothetical protein